MIERMDGPAQGRPRPQGPERPLVAFARDLSDRHVVTMHRHDHGQLVYCATGTMRVTTTEGVWIVPPQRAVWVPAGEDHEITCIGAVAMRAVYLLQETAPWLPRTCRVLDVTPLLREIVLEAMRLPPSYELEGPEARLVSVLVDQIERSIGAPVAALHLPMPRDRRLRAVTDRLIARPADARPLADWARTAGASVRTLARLFVMETGLSFRAWRQQLRLQEALARLALGEPVTGVAFAVGYDSPSAFIAMFRRALGWTPGQYLAHAASEHPR